MQEILSFKNHLLIAMPDVQDSHFTQSVVIICQHSKEGALGFVINHAISMRLEDLMEQMDVDIEDDEVALLPIFLGGPMQQDRGFILHTPAQKKWEITMNISDTMCLTTSQDILKSIACGEGPEKYLIILGYSAWNAGQLETEMQRNSWISTEYSESILFDTPISEKWKKAAKNMGLDIRLLSTQVAHA